MVARNMLSDNVAFEYRLRWVTSCLPLPQMPSSPMQSSFLEYSSLL